MQPPTVREVVSRLRKDGWAKARQDGSHQRWEKGGRGVTIAGKPSEHLDRGTWRSIREQAGWK